MTETVPVPNNAPAVPPTVPSKPALEDGCKVSLTIIGQASHSYSFFIPVSQRKSVGRNPSKCDIVLNQTDTQLSGQHCILEWDGRRLAACDVSTYNSTCVNGVRVQPHVWMNLENGATLRMGACDYRVKLEPGIQ